MKHLDLSILLAVDKAYVGQLRHAWPTWIKHRPEMFAVPFPVIVLKDASLPDSEIDFIKSSHPCVKVAPIPAIPGMTQQERMYSAFIHVGPFLADTEFAMKVDCDTVARRHDPLWCSEEIVRMPDGTLADLCASGWRYSKPSHAIDTMDKWGNTVPELKDFPAMNLPFDPKARRVDTPGRIAGYVTISRVDFSRWASTLCRRLPLPSQDTYLWYCAKRTGRPIKLFKMKRVGWDFTNWRSLPEVAKEICG